MTVTEFRASLLGNPRFMEGWADRTSRLGYAGRRVRRAPDPLRPATRVPVTAVALVVVLVALPIAMMRPAAARSSGPEDRLACPASGATRANGPGAATIWTAPLEPAAGKPLRVLAVSEASLADTELVITAPKGPAETSRLVRRTGPPFAIEASVAAPQAGKVRIALRRGGKDVACRIVEVAAKGHRPAVARAVGPGTWVSARAWDRTTESFYAAWIESLFDAPLSETLGFRPLAQALRDPDRNWLHDYLGLGEDDPKAKTALVAAPDCADLPYFSRAYFSWKLGLPYGFRDCDRGTDTRPPRCGGLVTNESPIEGAPRDALGAMKKFLRVLANKVHSGSARTALKDDETDYYPVALSRDALRPGTVFADPYGHVLMSVKWVPQERDTGGILLAVDGQADGSVGRKRFWEGTFLYANDIAGAGPGWKRFRPLVKGPEGKLVQLSNAALAADERFPAFSTEQASLARDDFYARMGKLINPKGLDA